MVPIRRTTISNARAFRPANNRVLGWRRIPGLVGVMAREFSPGVGYRSVRQRGQSTSGRRRIQKVPDGKTAFCSRPRKCQGVSRYSDWKILWATRSTARMVFFTSEPEFDLLSVRVRFGLALAVLPQDLRLPDFGRRVLWRRWDREAKKRV